MKNWQVRPLQKKDREMVRWICCQTGFLGKPVDALFEDRELFADFLTQYYTDAEPESSVVLEESGRVTGYVLGCRFPRKQKMFFLRHVFSLAARAAWRYFFRYNAASRKYIRWLLIQGRKQTPHTPQDTPHFHINLLPEARSIVRTRVLIDSFLRLLIDAGEKQVYGQMVVFEGRREERTFARYGFRVLDRAEVTKYRELTPKPVYLFTVMKDLQRGAMLYDRNLNE
ncbi:MAG: GNAT family acetyltransferase [bacterium]